MCVTKRTFAAIHSPSGNPSALHGLYLNWCTASRNEPSKYPTDNAWSNCGGSRLHPRHACSGLWTSVSGESKGLPHRGHTGPCIREKSAQQVEQKKGMPESPTGSLQKEQEVGRIKSRMRLKKRIAPRNFNQQYPNVK
jgi:hypothetical protein